MGLWRLVLLLALAPSTRAQAPASPSASQTSPLEIVLVDQQQVTPAAVRQWKAEGFKGVAIVLEDKVSEAACRAAAGYIDSAQLDVYWWIEVARNPKMADAHPQWMAALGMHQDWQTNFPKMPELKAGEVAKAYPWVPIGYREPFEAHLARAQQLLKRVPSGWRAVLLNDLQGGPSSCGCGNLQCRWAIDYHVRSTATKQPDDLTAARFIAELRKRIGEKTLIPVWTTECEEVDLPADKNRGRPGTQLCGTVGCATGACPVTFSRQWSALTSGLTDPVALLALHRAFLRTSPEFGGGPGWVTNAVGYLARTLPANDAKMFPVRLLWVVVEGAGSEGDERTARKAAAQAGVGAVLVARTRLEQSYEPRLISAK